MTETTETVEKPAIKTEASHKTIWGDKVISHGYTAVPNVMIRSQHRLGVNQTQMMILIQLLSYWFDKERVPFPSKKELADRLGLRPKTIQDNMKALETAGFVRREQIKTSYGDWGSNRYHLDGLVKRIKALEPDYEAEKEARKQAREAVELPKGKRQSAKK